MDHRLVSYVGADGEGERAIIHLEGTWAAIDFGGGDVRHFDRAELVANLTDYRVTG